MHIGTEINGSIDRSELDVILKEYLKLKGYDVKSIYYKVEMVQDEDDYFASYPLMPVFKRVDFVCKKDEK